MKTNEKKSVALLNFFGCKANRVRNSFKEPSKKLVVKLGLFLLFGIMILNLSVNVDNLKNDLKLNLIFNNQQNEDSTFCFNPVTLVKVRAEDSYEDYGTGMAVESYKDDASGAKENVIQAMDSKLFDGYAIVDWALGGLNSALGKLVEFSASLIDYLLTQGSFDKIIRANANIYIGWAAVRDILNLFFMILLLFSAFATIFQVEKYHLRKIIIMLIVMALLVNFSFPIALFIIDFSNSAMYFLVEQAFGTSISPSANMMRFANLGPALTNISGANGLTKTTSLILSVIFNFMVFITLFSIGLNLLIRMLAFVVLLILAPAGFAFAFFPDTKSVANSWWSALFKYAFLGPIMVFFLYLAVLLFNNNNFVISGDSSFLGSTIAFLVPIVFLWMGLIASQKFGGDGAGVAMNLAKKTGGLVKGAAVGAAVGGAYFVGKSADNVTGGHVGGTMLAVKNRWNQFGDDYKAKVNKVAAQRGEQIGVKGSTEKLVQENRKKWKDNNGVSNSEANRIDANGTKAEKMSLALERAENRGFDSDPDKAFAQYKAGLDALKDNQVYQDLFKRNVGKKNIDLEIRSNIESEMTRLGRALTKDETSTIAEKSFKKLDATNWKDQDINRTMEFNHRLGNDGVKEAGKSVIDGYSDSARNKVTSDMKGDKYEAGKKANLWV